MPVLFRSILKSIQPCHNTRARLCSTNGTLGSLTMAEGETDTEEGRKNFWIKEWDQGLWDLVYTKPGEALEKHFDRVTGGRKGLKILVPLSATTYDLIWLCDLGHTVVGTDLAESAAQRIFKQYKQTPIIEDVPSINGKLYKNSDGTFKYYVGDFFQFNEKLEGKFDVIWDSKAMCAVDERDRSKYFDVIRTHMGPECILLLEFFKKKDPEFPYLFTEEDIKGFYGDICDVQFLDEGIFDFSKFVIGDVDDDGNPVRRKDQTWRKDDIGQDMINRTFGMECYCLRKRE